MLNVAKYNPLNIALFLLLNLLKIIIGNKVIIKVLNLQKTREKQLDLIQFVVTSILNMIFVSDVNFIVNIIIQMILYANLFKIKSEKLALVIILNSIITSFSQCINKIILATVNLSFLQYANNMIVETYIEIIIKALILIFYKNWDIKDCMNEKIKNKIMTAVIISLSVVSIIKIKVAYDINNWYILFNLIITAYLILLLKYLLTVLKEENKKVLIENLEGCNKRLQENYDNVRAFKHDFNNIMQGIGGYIVANDIDGLKDMYKSISKECQEINEKQAINKDVINNPAIFNLINNKIKLAEEKNIKIKVDVYIDLNTLKVQTYDLCRILGILIDNAIEATCECEEKKITIKFIKDKYNNRHLIVIENPYKNYLIDVKKIYEKGFSSKKDKIMHGLGLWKVNQILKKNKNVHIYTCRDKLFKQQLEIY